MIRLVQLQNEAARAVAIVDEQRLVLLDGCASVYELAQACITEGRGLAAAARDLAGARTLSYDAVYAGAEEWRLLPPMDHPIEPARCLVSGTGLTHVASAKNRDAMHAKAEDLTDSMRMYRWGVEGGKPPAGAIGAAPEWFYKGNGTQLRAHGEPLEVPAFAGDGGEEPELAGVYVVDSAGVPRRLGFAQGNEFSDHEFERRNYLYLAASKLRTCAIGPELVVGADFGDVPGAVTVERGGAVLWSRAIRSGEKNMSHSLANLEHHHFKFELHRRPGDVHVHYFGADAFSFGEGVLLQNGDVMQVHFEGYGRPLRNPVRRGNAQAAVVAVASLEVE